MPFNWEKVSRNSDEYKACQMATAGIGVAAGGIVGGAGAPLTAGLSVPVVMAAGGLLGFAAGYLACPYLAPAVKRKLTDGVTLSSNEANNAVEAMHKYAGFTDERKSLAILAELRPHLQSAGGGKGPGAALARHVGAASSRLG